MWLLSDLSHVLLFLKYFKPESGPFVLKCTAIRNVSLSLSLSLSLSACIIQGCALIVIICAVKTKTKARELF